MRIQDWINKYTGLGLLVSVLLCGVGAVLGALLMDEELLGMDSAGIWMASVWALAACVGGRVALSKIPLARLPHAGVQSLLLYLIVWCIALAVSEVPDFSKFGWYITAGIWGGTFLAALLPLAKRKGKRKHTKAIKGKGRGKR